MTVRVRGMELPVNIKVEIEDFDWQRPNWKGDRLIACSPFRDERNPSFAVNLENGTFIDSGNDDEEWRKGNFVKLLSWLRRESYEETEDYLISLYSPQFGDLDKLELPSMDDWIEDDRNTKIFDRSELKPYLFKHPYLERRGIPFNVQRAFDVGYDPITKSVVLVWHDKNGNIVSWKHRNVHNKLFWYVKCGQPIRNHLYGIHWVVRKGFKRIWIVESEIDALTLWAKGIPAVAIGTSYLSPAKRDLILKAGIEELVIATDNDKDGRKAKRSIVKGLAGLVHLEEVFWQNLSYKDINDAREKVSSLTIREIDVINWGE
jgi:hypothetical protein